MIERIAAKMVVVITRLITGVRAEWRNSTLTSSQPRIYVANHTSHADLAVIWTSLPPTLRPLTRPVAGADYWLKGKMRRFFALRVFRAVLIDRTAAGKCRTALSSMTSALDTGASLIVFPEGTRNTSDAPLLPLRSGLYHLAKARPGVELVPVWINNLNRVLPKGEFLPVPLLCSAKFGPPITIRSGESKSLFLTRVQHALIALAGVEQSEPA